MDNVVEEKHILITVGLPARGKSYLSKKIAIFLNWQGFKCKIFSLDLYRRVSIGEVNSQFPMDNEDVIRAKCIRPAIDDMIEFFTVKCGQVGIIDGQNVSSARRRMIEDYITQNPSIGCFKYSLLWIESICDIESIIGQNIIINTLTNPEYNNWNKEDAYQDFLSKIKVWEDMYEPLSPEQDGDNCSFIKLFNMNKEVEIRNMRGFIQSKILMFLISLYPTEKPIYFIRHGESENNFSGKMGGDTNLTARGVKFALGLEKFFKEQEVNVWNSHFPSYLEDDMKCVIFTSTLQSCLQTVEHLKDIGKIYSFKCLDEINTGLFDGMSYDEMKENYQKDFAEKEKDKLHYIYPRGESYMDLIHRVEPVIYELERRAGPIIVVGHKAILRCLYWYYYQTPLEQMPYLKSSQNVVIRFVPVAYGYKEDRFEIDPDTFEVRALNLESFKFQFEENLYNCPTGS